MAAGAAAAGTVMCLSTLANTRPSEVAAAAPEGRHWFQLYAFKDAGVTRALIEEAVDSGFEAILRHRRRSPRWQPRARPPQRLHAAFRGLGTPAFDRGDRRREGAHDRGDLRADEPGADLGDVADLASECSVPVFVKGLLTAEDAELALDHGAAGVVVSNHGGRQLDRVPRHRRGATGDRRGGRRPRPRAGRRRHPSRHRRRHRPRPRRRRGAGRPARPLGPRGGGRGGCRGVLGLLRAELELALRSRLRVARRAGRAHARAGRAR